MKNKKELQDMIALLKLQRIGIPPKDVFGEDNHGPIDQQILILEMYVREETRAISDSLHKAHNDSNLDRLRAHDWARGECDEPPVEDNDIWVKKALARTAAAK